jgi:competence ComEA-like helix-hairpin-helix protein
MTMTTNRRSPRGTFTLAVALCAGLLMTASPSLAQKININTADEEELSELPGIGAKLSENIVKDREQNGKFLVVDDLSRVPGVSERLVAKIRNKVTTGGNGALVVKEGEAIPDDVVGRIMASFGDEPSIREVQEAAVEYARANPDTVDGWRWRVRTTALLPQVRSYVIGDIDRDIRTRTNLDATDAVVETTDNDNSVRLALQATWDLDRLVFDRNELGVWRETMRMANLRDRRRLQIDIKLAPPTELADRVRKELRIQELTADLDALTGGWFSGELEKSGKRPY